ncbi:MAG: PilW family protein, partial [Herminiimonas sp.]|nr:PilW family protein [Herminiimonas sp.]
YAIESIGRAVRQTAFEQLESETVPVVGQPTDSPNIVGFDATTFGGTPGTGLPTMVNATAPPSDLLQTRFIGAADGSVVDCAGVAASAVTTAAAVDAGRGWSIFFVKPVAGGEAELHCGYFNAAGSFLSSPIASGVESFQLLYGIDTNADGIPDRFVTATTLNMIDPLAMQPANPNSLWKKVVAVKIALLLRGQRTQRSDVENMVYDLFGSAYSDTSDVGSRILEQDLAAAQRARTRMVFSTVIQLRNRADGGNVGPLP